MKKSRQKKNNKYVHRNGVFVSNAMHFLLSDLSETTLLEHSGG